MCAEYDFQRRGGLLRLVVFAQASHLLLAAARAHVQLHPTPQQHDDDEAVRDEHCLLRGV